jgi:hypothetical protein
MTRQTTVLLFACFGILGALYLSWLLLNHQSAAPPDSSSQINHYSQQVTDEELKRVSDQLHAGMSYSDTALLLPSIGASRPDASEHGGVWYSVSSVGGFTLGLRFEHATEELRPELGTKKLADCKLNMQPGLYDPNGIKVLQGRGTSSPR